MLYLSPPLLVTLLLAEVYAALFHLLRGQRATELLRLSGGSVAGFLLGEGIARLLALGSPMLGDVHLLQGSLGAWIGLLVAHWWNAWKK